MLGRAHPGPVCARHAPRRSLRGLAAVSATPPQAPVGVAPSADHVLLWMAPGLEGRAGTAARDAFKGRSAAAAAPAFGPPSGILLPFGRLPGVTANLAGRTAPDRGTVAAARAQTGAPACPEVPPASLSPDPAAVLRVPAAVEPAGGLGLGVPGALGLAPLLPAGAAQAASGREGLLPALRTHPAGEALGRAPAVAFPVMPAGLVGVLIGHRHGSPCRGWGPDEGRSAGRTSTRKTPLSASACGRRTIPLRSSPSTGPRSSGG